MAIPPRLHKNGETSPKLFMKKDYAEMRVFRIIVNLIFAYLTFKSLNVADWFLGVHVNTLETVQGSLSWVITVTIIYSLIALISAYWESGHYRLGIAILWITTCGVVLHGAFVRNFWDWLW